MPETRSEIFLILQVDVRGLVGQGVNVDGDIYFRQSKRPVCDQDNT